MKTTEAKLTGPLGELASKIAKIVAEPLEELMVANTQMRVVVVVAPMSEPGIAVLPIGRVSGSAQTFEQVARSQKLLREAADSCGRVLYQSPASPSEVAKESNEIVDYSRKEFENWQSIRKCTHTRCAIRDAASVLATGVRMLQSIGTPTDVLQDVTRLVKEACRRAHLHDIEQSARGSA